MKKLIFILTVSCLFFADASAQFNRYIIQFRDKATNPYSLSNPSAYLSARAIDRRSRYGISIDSSDLPITPRYIDSIKNVPHVTLLNQSKWLNLVTIFTADPAALTKINSFPFVQSSNPIAARVAPGVSEEHAKFKEEKIEPIPGGTIAKTTDALINYGQTLNQITIHNGQFLHDRGYLGENMIIAMLDGGFASYKTNPAFDSIRMNNQVLGEWNFVNNIQNTDGLSGHGMNCLSTIAANRPGVMVGTSPHAKFWLFVTEDVSSEYPIEEVNWAAAAEFADSSGADVISSSLGYQDFDNSAFDYLYAQRNGNTAISTRAADLAAKKGMIVMNSAGNYGALTDQRKYVSCPADGDSVVAVGAINTSGIIAGFSSWGPNSAGKIKPNIVSVGQGTIVSDFNGNPYASNGTSFSNPNIAGLITALWGAFPEFSNMRIINAVQHSAHKFTIPDDRYGYGIPNMRTAFYILKDQLSRLQFGGSGWFKANPNPFTSQIDAAFIADNSGTVKLYLKKITGAILDSAVFTVDSLDYQSKSFLNLDPLPAGYYYVQYKSAIKDSTITLAKGSDLFSTDWIKVFPNPFNSELHLYFKAQLTGNVSLKYYDLMGRLINSTSLSVQKDNIYYYGLPIAAKLNSGIYILRFNDGVNKRTIKVFRK